MALWKHFCAVTQVGLERECGDLGVRFDLWKGESDAEKLIPEIEKLTPGASTDPEAQYGPVVSQAHKEKVENYIQMGVDEGAKLLIDGRNFKLQGHESGYFILTADRLLQEQYFAI